MNNKDFLSFYMEYYNATKQKGISVDATNICPLQCPACPRQDEKRRPQINNSEEVTLEEYKRIVEFSSMIRLCGQLSDPIYHKDFHKLLEYCSVYPQKRFSIHTNGTRKKTDWWIKSFELSTFNVRWVFGLDGTDQETANIYRVNTRFDEVMNAMKLGVSMGVNIIWQFIIFKHNEHQVELAKQIAKENKITLELISTDRWFDNFELLKKSGIEQPSDQWNNIENGINVRKYIYIKS